MLLLMHGVTIKIVRYALYCAAYLEYSTNTGVVTGASAVGGRV